MVKYVKEFNPNIDNITTLLVNSVDCDISDLKKQVTQSLAILIENVFSKIGDIYEYLTDVEKIYIKMRLKQSLLNKEKLLLS